MGTVCRNAGERTGRRILLLLLIFVCLCAEFGAEQEIHGEIRRRIAVRDVRRRRWRRPELQPVTVAQMESGSGIRQFVLAGVRVHQRISVRLVSAARVRAPVQANDQTVHRIGYPEIRHDQPTAFPHEVRTFSYLYPLIILYKNNTLGYW